MSVRSIACCLCSGGAPSDDRDANHASVTDYSHFEEDWDPWGSTAYSDLTVTDINGVTASSPFKAHAATFHQARLTMKLHFGVLLREHGYRPAWLKEG